MTGSSASADYALAVLSTISGSTIGCRSYDDVAAGVLEALRASGLIHSGAIEVHTRPLLRHTVGPVPDLTGSACMLFGASNADDPTATRSALDCTDCILEAIPTAAAPPACVLLTPSCSPPPGLGRSVSEQLALALDRAALVEQAAVFQAHAAHGARAVQTIYDIGRSIAMADNARLLEIVTERTAMLMDAQACSLMRLNRDTQKLTIAGSYGLSEDVVFVTERALGEGIAGHVAQSGEPLVIRDGEEHPHLPGVALSPEIGSSMIVPMRAASGEVMGVLSIRRRHPSPDFNEADLRLFSVFAGQAALAIANNELYTDLRNRVRQLSTLSDLTQVVISTLDIERLLGSVADSLTDVVKFDRCAIYMIDRATRRLVPRIVRGYRPEVIGRSPVRLGEGVIGIVAKKQMPIIESDARNALQPLRGFARALGAASFVAVPIVTKGQTIGVVLADNKRSRRTITSDSVDLLTTFVNQAGLAIENAQLYEDREQRFQEINRLATQTDNILRSMAASVIVVDADGRVTRWNKASEEMWDIPEERATGCSYLRLIRESGLPQDEADEIDRLMRLVLESGRPHQVHKLALHPQRRGERFLNLLMSPLVDRSGARLGVIQILEDVTRETHMEAEMARIRRLADIGQLAAKMAHEVRNPLSSIKGAAQLVRNEYEDTSGLREFLDIIIEEVNALSGITTDLLDFARPMQLDLHRTDLNDLVTRTAAFLASFAADNRVMISTVLPEDMPKVVADPRQIEQVLRNMVINGVQAMPDGGELTVATFFDPEAGETGFSVADHGVGIPDDRLTEIFQPFHTTKTKGSGLGLCIVSKIVTNHGGHVEVASRVGEGSTFTVHLPLQPVGRPQGEGPDGLTEQAMTSALPDV